MYWKWAVWTEVLSKGTVHPENRLETSLGLRIVNVVCDCYQTPVDEKCSPKSRSSTGDVWKRSRQGCVFPSLGSSQGGGSLSWSKPPDSSWQVKHTSFSYPSCFRVGSCTWGSGVWDRPPVVLKPLSQLKFILDPCVRDKVEVCCKVVSPLL